MPKLIDITPEQRFFAMFVGPSGSGKTCAECSFPKPIEVLDFDGRIRGAYGHKWLPMDDINYTYFPPRAKDLVTQVENKLNGIEMAAAVMQPIPKTLILDSLTSECLAMLMQAAPLTHNLPGKNATEEERKKKRGRFLGTVAMAGPEDYGFEAQMTYNIMSFMRSLPVQNVIVSAHLIPTFGKADPDNEFSNTVQVGEKLSVRDKIGANLGIYFDHVFQFKKAEVNDEERFAVKFRGDPPRTAYSQLPNGWIEITGKNFYNEILMPYVKTNTPNS